MNVYLSSLCFCAGILAYKEHTSQTSPVITTMIEVLESCHVVATVMEQDSALYVHRHVCQLHQNGLYREHSIEL